MLSPILPARRTVPGIALMVPLILLAGCGGGQANDARKAKRTPTVGYVVMKPTNVADTTELTGRVTAYQTSEVRPQVSGLIRRRLFAEGSLVRQGQTLYEIDPSLFVAAVNQARANVQAAQAQAEAARVQAERFKPLAEIQAVSAQDYTNAVASARQSAAQVAQARAALQTAQVNLRFTRVPAPISGRIGRSLFTQGALVTANQADPLALIQRLDPIFVDIQQSSGELLALRRALSSGGVLPAKARVTLKLEDGTDYGETGEVEFTEVTVDPATGTVTLRARFANPRGILLPGMFVRAQFAQGLTTGAFLVPQQGVSRDAKGNASVLLLGPGNKPVARTVVAPRTHGTDWVVTQGLKAGDRVITEGLLAAKPGMAVKAVPAGSPQRIKAPAKGQGAPGGGGRG